MCGSRRSITPKSASTYSTGDNVARRIADAASMSERLSGFIFKVQTNRPEFFDFDCELPDLGTELFSSFLTEFFLGCLLKIHCLSMVPFGTSLPPKWTTGVNLERF